eukprot:6780391-Pyramimonas_sp.AAC.1
MVGPCPRAREAAHRAAAGRFPWGDLGGVRDLAECPLPWRQQAAARALHAPREWLLQRRFWGPH